MVATAAELSETQDATTLTVIGSGFTPDAIVEVGDTAIDPTRVETTELRVDGPVQAYRGRATVDLKIRTGGPTGTVSNVVSLKVVR